MTRRLSWNLAQPAVSAGYLAASAGPPIVAGPLKHGYLRPGLEMPLGPHGTSCWADVTFGYRCGRADTCFIYRSASDQQAIKSAPWRSCRALHAGSGQTSPSTLIVRTPGQHWRGGCNMIFLGIARCPCAHQPGLDHIFLPSLQRACAAASFTHFWAGSCLSVRRSA